jgi:hypothetical protein
MTRPAGTAAGRIALDEKLALLRTLFGVARQRDGTTLR